MQSIVTIALLLVCCVAGPIGPAPASNPNQAVNINHVFGMDDANPQTMMAPMLWLVLLMAVNVIVFHIPTHFVLKRVYPTVTK